MLLIVMMTDIILGNFVIVQAAPAETEPKDLEFWYQHYELYL